MALEEIVEAEMAEWQEACNQDKNKYGVIILPSGQAVIEVVEE